VSALSLRALAWIVARDCNSTVGGQAAIELMRRSLARAGWLDDAQHRLLLEISWEALEHAGIVPDSLRGTRTGLVMGLSSWDYSVISLERRAEIDPYVSTGNVHSAAVGRIAYLLGLHGPAMAVDTACSSSLVALHLACQSLRMRESDLALAGGVNMSLSPITSIALSKLSALSPTGRCKTFDAAADGFVRSEGCGVVVLKRLADALRDKDRVLAVVRGSAVNQDGRSNGLMAPNPAAQMAVLRAACANARVQPREVDYVEAHGTGTLLGDPIEARALGAPWHITARMLGNVAVDGVVGLVPVAGDAFDVMFRANVRNVRMLKRWLDKQPR